jgi:hypothetical protein
MPTDAIITEPSICIPRTLNNVTWRVVKDTFEKLLGKGTVDRVDIVTRRDDDTQFCRIFVHMRYWPLKEPGVAAWRQTLVDGGELKVVHNHPWFWKCVASRVPKPEKKKPVSAEPYIMPVDKTPDAPTLAEHIPIEPSSSQGGDEEVSPEHDDKVCEKV